MLDSRVVLVLDQGHLASFEQVLDPVEDLALVDLVDAGGNQSLVEPFDGVPFQEDDSNHHEDPQVLGDPEDPVVDPFVVDLDPVETFLEVVL